MELALLGAPGSCFTAPRFCNMDIANRGGSNFCFLIADFRNCHQSDGALHARNHFDSRRAESGDDRRWQRRPRWRIGALGAIASSRLWANLLTRSLKRRGYRISPQLERALSLRAMLVSTVAGFNCQRTGLPRIIAPRNYSRPSCAGQGTAAKKQETQIHTMILSTNPQHFGQQNIAAAVASFMVCMRTYIVFCGRAVDRAGAIF